MRVNNVSSILYRHNANTVNTSDIKASSPILFSAGSYNDVVSFSGKASNTKRNRRRQLDRLGVSDKGVEKIAGYGKKRYTQALRLLKKGCYEENIELASRYREKKYNRALELLSHNIFDLSLTSLVKLGEEKFKRVISLSEKGFDSDCLVLYSQLNEREYQNAINTIREGSTPISALYMSRLPENHKSVFISLTERGLSPEEAYDIVFQSDEDMQKCIQHLNNGIRSGEVVNYNNLSHIEQARAFELISRNVSDCASIDIAGLSDEEYIIAQSMIKDGVYPEYINDIISIENGKTEVPEYQEYRDLNYSRTSSYSLAMLNEAEKDDLDSLIGVHPEIEKLFEDEYRVEMIHVQDIDEIEGILKKEIYLENGTKVTLIKTFNENGDKTVSRTEETSNHETYSLMPHKSDIYRIKYNKTGDIREMNRIIVSPETKEVIGVEHLKESDILPGAYEAVFYDIKDFKTDNTNENIDTDISEAVTSKGIPISTVTKEADGTIVYKESFRLNDIKSIRLYKEFNDDNGDKKYTYYSYKILDENNEPLMNMERSFEKLQDGSVINKINGIEYLIQYDDENKTVTVSDGKRTKTLDFKNKFADFSHKRLWENVKNLQTDNLLLLDKNVKHWNYCEDSDSAANIYSKTISTGQDMSIISHEIGHFMNFLNGKISKNEDFLDVYMDEMDNFLFCVPYNEQEFVLYCTPKCEIESGIDSDGADEFVAEANMILSSYGAVKNKLKTRPQFLVRYFPESIVKVAEMTGKTSVKSLLDE